MDVSLEVDIHVTSLGGPLMGLLLSWALSSEGSAIAIVGIVSIGSTGYG